MSNANDSFIDEVSEAVRRDRLNLWFRRWGWAVLLLVLLVVAAAAWIEWRQAQARAEAELRGEAILSALELPEAAERISSLEELPTAGEGSLAGRLLLAAEQQASGDLATAEATYRALGADGDVPPLYRDLAMLKGLMLAVHDDEDLEGDVAALEDLAAPGAPFRLLALETIATARLRTGDAPAAIEALGRIREDAEVTDGQAQRVDALLTALGAPSPAGEPAPGTDVEAPVEAPSE